MQKLPADYCMCEQRVRSYSHGNCTFMKQQKYWSCLHNQVIQKGKSLLQDPRVKTVTNKAMLRSRHKTMETVIDLPSLQRRKASGVEQAIRLNKNGKIRTPLLWAQPVSVILISQLTCGRTGAGEKALVVSPPQEQGFVQCPLTSVQQSGHIGSCSGKSPHFSYSSAH